MDSSFHKFLHPKRDKLSERTLENKKAANIKPILPRENVDYMYEKTAKHVKSLPKKGRFADQSLPKYKVQQDKDWMPIRTISKIQEDIDPPLADRQNFVYCEDTNTSLQMNQDEFWEFVESTNWKRQIRLCEGPLIDTIFDLLQQLHKDGYLTTYKASHFDAMRHTQGIFKKGQSIRKNIWQGLNLPVKVKLVYYMVGPNYVPSASHTFSGLNDNKDLLRDLTQHTEWIEAVQARYGHKYSIDKELLTRKLSDLTKISKPQDTVDNQYVLNPVPASFKFQTETLTVSNDGQSKRPANSVNISLRNDKNVTPSSLYLKQGISPSTTQLLESQSKGPAIVASIILNDEMILPGPYNDSQLSYHSDSASNAVSQYYDSSLLEVDRELNQSVSPDLLHNYITANFPPQRTTLLNSFQTIDNDETLTRAHNGKPTDPQENLCPTRDQDPYNMHPSEQNKTKIFLPKHKLPEKDAIEPKKKLDKTLLAKDIAKPKKNLLQEKAVVSPKKKTNKMSDTDDEIVRRPAQVIRPPFQFEQQHKLFAFSVRKLNHKWSRENFFKKYPKKKPKPITEVEETSTSSVPNSVEEDSLTSLPNFKTVPGTATKIIKLQPAPYTERKPTLPKVENIPKVVNVFERMSDATSKDKLIRLCCEHLVRFESVTIPYGMAKFRTIKSLIINRGAD